MEQNIISQAIEIVGLAKLAKALGVTYQAIRKWETKLGVRVSNYFLQRMKTKWGSCNPRAKSIRLNSELVKKPKDLLHYIVCHEAAHLLESTHNGRFTALLDKHYPSWKEARMELNSLPLSAERWKE